MGLHAARAFPDALAGRCQCLLNVMVASAAAMPCTIACAIISSLLQAERRGGTQSTRGGLGALFGGSKDQDDEEEVSHYSCSSLQNSMSG